jgi:hypothetical protein
MPHNHCSAGALACLGTWLVAGTLSVHAGQAGQPATSPPAGGPAAPAAAAGPATSTAGVSVVAPAVIRFDASKSSAEGTVRVTSPRAAPLVLDAGAIVLKSTKEVLHAAVAFQPGTLELQPNEVREVKVLVSEAFFEGEAEVEVLNRGARFGSLSVTRGPLAVTLVDTQAVFRQGEKVALRLRNDSPYSYRLAWMARIGPHRYCGPPSTAPARDKACLDDTSDWSVVTIPAKDTQTIDIDPPAAWFDTSFVERPAPAFLSLSPGPSLPKSVHEMRATLRGPFVEWQWTYMLLLLAAGAVFSLVVRHWVPNMHRKRELKDHIRRVRSKINGFSDDIDDEVRTLARVQGFCLDALRKSTLTIMPDYATVAAVCAQGIALLDRRVDLIEEVDSIYAVERVKWAMCPPPSQVDRVEDRLRGALETLKKAELSEAEFIAVKGEIDAARAQTQRMGTEDPEFGKDLEARLLVMRDELKHFEQAPAYVALKAELPGIFRTLDAAPAAGGAQPGPGALPALPAAPENGAPPGSAGEPIPALRYSLLDYNLSALAICRDYLWLAESAKDAAELRTAIGPLLVQHLARQSWGELRQARLLLKQFREHSYESDIWEAVEARDAAMYIVHEPTDVWYHRLVEFRIYFRRSELNWSAARELVTPVWHFDDGCQPRGWTISHFFTDTRSSRRKWLDRWRTWTSGTPATWTEQVRVSFEGSRGGNGGTDTGGAGNGQLRTHDDALTIPVTVQADPSDQRTRTFSEAIGLAVSIFIPLVSLMATAQDQLVQSSAGGALTIFLLGFGSDAIISVFKQRMTPAP